MTLPEFTVRDGLWDDETKVHEVKQHRHTIIFPERHEPSIVTFCNNCGGSFTQNQHCAECGYPLP